MNSVELKQAAENILAELRLINEKVDTAYKFIQESQTSKNPIRSKHLTTKEYLQAKANAHVYKEL
jgi:hypothetical protein